MKQAQVFFPNTQVPGSVMQAVVWTLNTPFFSSLNPSETKCLHLRPDQNKVFTHTVEKGEERTELTSLYINSTIQIVLGCLHMHMQKGLSSLQQRSPTETPWGFFPNLTFFIYFGQLLTKNS